SGANTSVVPSSMATLGVTNFKEWLSIRTFSSLFSANTAVNAFSRALRPLMCLPVWSTNSPFGVQKAARALASALWNALMNASAHLAMASLSWAFPFGSPACPGQRTNPNAKAGKAAIHHRCSFMMLVLSERYEVDSEIGKHQASKAARIGKSRGEDYNETVLMFGEW